MGRKPTTLRLRLGYLAKPWAWQNDSCQTFPSITIRTFPVFEQLSLWRILPGNFRNTKFWSLISANIFAQFLSLTHTEKEELHFESNVFCPSFLCPKGPKFSTAVIFSPFTLLKHCSHFSALVEDFCWLVTLFMQSQIVQQLCLYYNHCVICTC